MNLPLLRCVVWLPLHLALLMDVVLLALNYPVLMFRLTLPVAGIAALIKDSPLIIIITLITVIAAIRPAVLIITIPSDIIPSVSSYLIGEPAIKDKNPWSSIIIRAVPVAIVVDVIAVTIVNDVIRTTDGY